MGGSILELFVFDQLPDQLPAWVLTLVFALGLHLLLDGQELAALDVHQRRRHDHELAGNFEVQQPHRFDVLDELRCQLGEIHLINVHLLLFDQIKEQIERALKDLEFYFVFCHYCPAIRLMPGRCML